MKYGHEDSSGIRRVRQVSLRWLTPFAAASLFAGAVTAQTSDTLAGFLRLHNGDERSLRRLLAQVRAQQVTERLDWQAVQRRARWSGAAPQLRFRFLRGLDDVLRARSDLGQSMTAPDIDSTASASQGREVTIEVKWAPSTLIFHPAEVRMTERRIASRATHLAHRIRIARLFMTRRALLIRYHRASQPKVKLDLWHQILEHDVTLDVETNQQFSQLRKRSSK
ncbi:MAG: hypothetical protein VX589_16255 [Myxococcota bacterium]|nr:hypothetical protein [Myxococcota bacterium]